MSVEELEPCIAGTKRKKYVGGELNLLLRPESAEIVQIVVAVTGMR
jgi:hypothetical protein